MRLEQEIQKIKNNSIEQNKIFKHWESKLFYDELDSLEKLSIKQLSLLSLLKKDYLSFFRLGEKKLKEVCEIISSDYDEEIWIDPVISLHSIDITNFDESNVSLFL